MTNTGQTLTGQVDEQVPAQEPQVDWEKRYKDLQSHYDKTRVQKEQEIQRLREASTVFTPPKTAEELESFKSENPDWMGVIETVAHDIASSSIQPIQAQLKETREREAVAQILLVHPDFPQVANSPEFQQWAEEQGPDIKSWLEEKEDASKVIRAMNYYKAMAGSSQAPVSQPTYQDPAALAVSTNGNTGVLDTAQPQGKSFSKREIAQMHPDVYEKNYEAIKFAAQNGLITD